MDIVNPVVDIGSPELYTHAYSTLEVFRIEILVTLDWAEFVEFGSKGQTVFFFQYSTFSLPLPNLTVFDGSESNPTK
jgi:hypothetical protein